MFGYPSEHSSYYSIPIFNPQTGTVAIEFATPKDLKEAISSLNMIQMVATYYWTRKHYGALHEDVVFLRDEIIARAKGAKVVKDLVNSYYWSRSNFGALSEETLLILKEISSMAE